MLYYIMLYYIMPGEPLVPHREPAHERSGGPRGGRTVRPIFKLRIYKSGI